MKKFRKIAVVALGVISAIGVTAGISSPVCVYADAEQEVESGSYTNTIVHEDKIQVVDSSGAELDNIIVQVTVTLEDGTVITDEVSSSDYATWDQSEPWNVILGRNLPDRILNINIYEGKADYRIHFLQVPEGYEIKEDIVFSYDSNSDETVLISSPDATAELGYFNYGLERIGLRKAGEDIGVTGWMIHPAVTMYGDDLKYYVGRDGKRYAGWHYMTEKEGVGSPCWMYFDKEHGNRYLDWCWMDEYEDEETPHWSYFGSDGILHTGWNYLDQEDGEETPHWSYFGTNGWLRTGWHYLVQKDGEMIPHWSYFGGNGWLRTGWQHLAEKDGERVPHWSYFGGNGWLRTGWQHFDLKDGELTPHWSYFGTDGWLRTGWQDMGKGTQNPDGNTYKHRSYFGDNGWLRTGKQFIDGTEYEFSDNGWLK